MEKACRGVRGTEPPPAPLTGIPLAHEAEELLGPGSPGHPLQEMLQGQRQLLLRGDSAGAQPGHPPWRGAAPGTTPSPPPPPPPLPQPRGSAGGAAAAGAHLHLVAVGPVGPVAEVVGGAHLLGQRLGRSQEEHGESQRESHRRLDVLRRAEGEIPAPARPEPRRGERPRTPATGGGHTHRALHTHTHPVHTWMHTPSHI